MGAEIQDGAFIVARAIFNSSLWTMRAEDKVVALTCIGIANWKERLWFDGAEQLRIGRGQFVRSWAGLAKDAGESIQTVRTSVQHLEKVGFLTRKPTGRYHVFTIPKYDHYQDLTKYSDSIAAESNRIPNSPLTGTQQDINSSLTTNNKGIREEGKNTPSGTVAFLARVWNEGPGIHLNGNKARELIQAAMDLGVAAGDIEAAFMDHDDIRGKKIWEVLDPIRKRFQEKGFAERRDSAFPKF